jgi:hypothetical protein
LDLDAEACVIGGGGPDEGDGAALFLVLHDLAEGDARGIVDADVDEPPAQALATTSPAALASTVARDPVADAVDSAELFDTDVDEFARVFAFIAAHPAVAQQGREEIVARAGNGNSHASRRRRQRQVGRVDVQAARLQGPGPEPNCVARKSTDGPRHLCGVRALLRQQPLHDQPDEFKAPALLIVGLAGAPLGRLAHCFRPPVARLQQLDAGRGEVSGPICDQDLTAWAEDQAFGPDRRRDGRPAAKCRLDQLDPRSRSLPDRAQRHAARPVDGLQVIDISAGFDAQRRIGEAELDRALADDRQLRIGQLKLMKRTAFLINIARGGVVDQKALTECLQSRRIAGAGLDVLEKEPPDESDPLLLLDNVVLSAHALNWTENLEARLSEANLKAVFAVAAGRDPVGVVNREVLRTHVWREKVNRLSAASASSSGTG